MQDQITLSSADFAKRLAFLKECQGITLGDLAHGSPSTAKSWLEGKQPRRDKWSGISERLGLSETLIFFGKPDSPSDYAFIAKWRERILDAEALLKEHEHERGARFRAVEEGRDMRINPRFAQPPAEPTRREVEDHLAAYLDIAEQVPGGVSNAYFVLTGALSLEEIQRRLEQ
jgi:hypothetical protein